MVKIKAVIVTVLIVMFLFVPPLFAGWYFCPNQKTLDTEEIYRHLVPDDFPGDLMWVFCLDPSANMPREVVGYPALIVGQTVEDKENFADMVVIWFLDKISGNFVGFVLYSKGKYETLWISKYTPEGFSDLIEKVNREENKKFSI
jgi:hypothetical protein